MIRRSFLKDITGVLSSNVFAILSGLLISVILSRKLGPVGFGIYSAILVLPTIVISFAQMGIRASSIYYIGRKQYDLREIISSILLILVLTSGLGIVITLIGFLFLNDESYESLYILLVLLMIPFRLAMAYFGGIFLGKEQIGRSNFINWFTEFMHLIAVVILVWMMDLGITGALQALVLSHIIITAWALAVLGRNSGLRLIYRPEIIRRLLSMGIVFALSFVIIQLNFRIDVLLLKELSTMDEVGYYSLGVSIAEKLWQLPLAIGVVLMSRTANTTDQDAINTTTARLVRVSLLAGVAASLLMFLLAPWFLPAVWGEKFRASIQVVQYILPGILFISVYRILSSRLSGIGRPEVSIYVFLPALVINVLLNLWWIPGLGAFGAVMATNVSYSLGTLAYIIVYSKIVHMPMSVVFRFQKEDFNFLKGWINRSAR